MAALCGWVTILGVAVCVVVVVRGAVVGGAVVGGAGAVAVG